VPNDPLQPIIITRDPRRRRPRRKLRIGVWAWRVGLCTLAIAVGSSLLLRATEPYSMRHRQKQDTAELLKSLADAQEQNRSLKRQIEMMRSGQGLEIEARKLGYVKKGEIPLQISFAKEPLKHE
jgi:cell division protein FtsB